MVCYRGNDIIEGNLGHRDISFTFHSWIRLKAIMPIKAVISPITEEKTIQRRLSGKTKQADKLKPEITLF
jgi:hypothetical protein